MNIELTRDMTTGVDLISINEMFESTPSCLKVISHNGLLLHMNPRGLSLIEAEDMASVYKASVYDLVEDSHKDRFIAFNKHVCAGNKDVLVFEIIGLKGTRRWMESYAAPYMMENGEVAHIAITNDITEKIEAENEIAYQREALANSARLASLGQFVGGIAHEINNPLAIISGKLTLLDINLENDAFEKQAFKESLAEVIETTDRISQIIRNLKTFSRDPQKDPLDPCSMLNIIEETLSLCAENFRLNNINIEYAGDTEIKILCQKVQISQVLMNLLNNAFDAIADKKSKWIKVQSHLYGGMVRVSITDSGKGISKGIVDKMFDPFYTTKEVGRGTGLGLSICSNILLSHGGKLYYNNRSPNTQFVLEIPSYTEEF